MAQLNNVPNYVKFMRGTKAAYETLKTAGQVSNDTLYFVYENSGSSTGILYLGTKVIGGSDVEESIPQNLSDLGDVLLANTQSGQILTWNGNSWINTTVEQLLQYNENIFELDVDNNNELTLVGFSDATAGQIPQVGTNGKISWVTPGNLTEITNIQKSITDLEETKADKSDVYLKSEVDALIANVDHLKRRIVNSISEIDVSAPDAGQYIYLVPAEESQENNSYFEYLVLDGKIEKVGTWNVDLSGYVTTDTFNTTVTNLNDLISGNTTLIEENIEAISQNTNDIIILKAFDSKVGDLSALIINDASYTTLVEQVNDLTLKLTWEEIPTV